MNYTEESAWFGCAGDTLLGILARPQTAPTAAVVVIVGGPQYRVGSHRQFVLLARSLASAGIAVLRFDYRGMGDSEGDVRDFETINADIAAAIDLLYARLPSLRQVALWGLCDGASAALLYCHQAHDPRVGALCLLNPWVRSDTSLARTQVKHYYRQRVMQKEFWNKLLRGKVAFKALSELTQNLQVALGAAAGYKAAATDPAASERSPVPFQHAMASAWDCFDGHILLLLSGQDYIAKEFLEYVAQDAAWHRAWEHPRLVRHELPDADHTFSNAASRAAVAALTLTLGLSPAQPEPSEQPPRQDPAAPDGPTCSTGRPPKAMNGRRLDTIH